VTKVKHKQTEHHRISNHSLLANVNVHVRYMLSPVRLSSVCNVRAPYSCMQAVQIFGNISTALGTY